MKEWFKNNFLGVIAVPILGYVAVTVYELDIKSEGFDASIGKSENDQANLRRAFAILLGEVKIPEFEREQIFQILVAENQNEQEASPEIDQIEEDGTGHSDIASDESILLPGSYHVLPELRRGAIEKAISEVGSSKEFSFAGHGETSDLNWNLAPNSRSSLTAKIYAAMRDALKEPEVSVSLTRGEVAEMASILVRDNQKNRIIEREREILGESEEGPYRKGIERDSSGEPSAEKSEQR